MTHFAVISHLAFMIRKSREMARENIRTKLIHIIAAGCVLMVAPSVTWALGAGGQRGEAQKGADFSGLFMLVIIFAIFYFLLIRPQQKRAKEHQELLKGLRRGDEVVTSGGIYGRVHEIDGPVVQLEVADRVRIRVAKEQISSRKGSEAKTVPDRTDRKGKLKSDKEKKG